MAAKMITTLMTLATLSKLAQSHRGEDEQGKAKNDRGSLVSLQMLPKGNVHSEFHKSSPVSSHDFHDGVPASLLEQSTNELELGRQSISPAPAPAPSPDDDHTLTLKIQYPYQQFVTEDPKPAEQHSGSVGVHVSGSQSQPTQATAQAASNDVNAVNKKAWVGKDFAGLFKAVSYSVIRIQTITAQVNWFEPYQQPQDMEFTGTGMAIDIPGGEDDPIFITNAHVVRDAHNVQIQIPAVGGQFFEAYVPLICDEFDLAVVQLVDPAKFIEALKQSENGKLKMLPVDDYPLILGLEVASVGFPLGSTSLKLSRGVISGTEEVGDFICYQTTAPISPGSSGGPLFALDEGGELRVIGATFASAAAKGSQNVNYVVPAIAITQVRAQYLKERDNFKNAQAANVSQPLGVNGGHGGALLQQPESGKSISQATVAATVAAPAPATGSAPSAASKEPDTKNSAAVAKNGSVVVTNALRQLRNQKNKKLPHFQFKIAPIDAVGIEANPVLYKSYGCNSGVFISKVLDSSVFKVASDPPVKAGSFLTSVDGVPLDSFGMGRTSQFLHDPTPFESFLMMKVRPGDTVKVKTCGKAANEKEVEHTISMEWTPEKYEDPVGIHNVVEPFFDHKSMEYELFAGITVMQLTVNHIIKLLRAGQPPTLGRWLLPENQKQKHLLITHVEKGTYASRVVAPGMVVAKVNGKEMGDLQEYRKGFMPPEGEDTWTLETDRGVLFTTNFQESLFEQFKKAEMGLTFMFCRSVVDAYQKEKEKAAPAGKPSQGAPASLAQTGIAANRSFMQLDFDASEERVSRLVRRQALAMSASGLGDDSEDEVRRRMRVAQSGFQMFAASQYVPEDEPTKTNFPM